MKVIIIGGRGTSTVIAEQIDDARTRFGMDIETLGFALDDHSMGNSVNGYPIVCGIRELHEKYGAYGDVRYIYCLYRADVIAERANLLYSLNLPLDKFCNFIHPSALVAKSVKMGYGNVILANSVINSNVTIGNFNILNTGVVIEHDSSLGNNNFLAAHVCTGGSCHIGNANFIGLSASLRGKPQSIGNENYIGMGANVVKDVGDRSLVYGNPAVLHGKR